MAQKVAACLLMSLFTAHGIVFNRKLKIPLDQKNIIFICEQYNSETLENIEIFI